MFNNMIGTLPTRNYTEGQFELADPISGEKMAETILKGRETCYACVVRCKRVVEIEEGKYKFDPIYGGPEYEQTHRVHAPAVQILEIFRALPEAVSFARGFFAHIHSVQDYCAACGIDNAAIVHAEPVHRRCGLAREEEHNGGEREARQKAS